MTAAYTRAPVGAAPRGRPWIPVGIWSGAIFVLSCIPLGGLAWLEPTGLDRVFHAAFYAVLAAFITRAMAANGSSESAAAAGTMVGALAFGAYLEWIQGFVGRSPDFLDWAADGGGVLLTLILRVARNHLTERFR
jgi:hypothetical protein